MFGAADLPPRFRLDLPTLILLFRPTSYPFATLLAAISEHRYLANTAFFYLSIYQSDQSTKVHVPIDGENYHTASNLRQYRTLQRVYQLKRREYVHVIPWREKCLISRSVRRSQLPNTTRYSR